MADAVDFSQHAIFFFYKNHHVSLKVLCTVFQQSYKAEYEDIKTRCFFPQTITPEYEAGKKLQGCSDVSSISLLYIYVYTWAWVCVCSFGFRLMCISKKCCIPSVFYRKPTGNIQTRWNLLKSRIPQSWFKLPSMPKISVTYVLHYPLCSIIKCIFVDFNCPSCQLLLRT